ncbi:MAG: hypothetical protein FJY76_00370 [Candidatus Aenigmarchaeota archaeon]|nr:hypothetical protein [Candidatus Aenigmarchaeota archaeon]
MDSDMVAFGDLHLAWRAADIILDEARKSGIDIAFNLGDEDTFCGGPQSYYDRLYGAMREFRDEKPGRRLICLIGDKTGGVPSDLKRNYVGTDSRGRIKGSLVFREGNVIAAHNGRWIIDELGDFIRDYPGGEPLVVFHGHSHSMGVLPEYRWLKDDEKVDFLPEGGREVRLEPGRVYWANPGAPCLYATDDSDAANFLVYSPSRRIITLRSILYPRPRLADLTD